VSEPKHPIFARLYDPVMAWPERHLLADHRRFLAEGASGRVLDLGAGTGAQLRALADQGAAVETIDAVEPDPHMRRRAQGRARDLDVAVTVSDARAEDLPFDDDAFDLVVASFVFCTIDDTAAALDEVCRVLAPGGEFRFVEHVKAGGLAGLAHDLFAPAWGAVAGGCHLNRRTDRQFLGDDRFDSLAFDRFDDGVSRLLPVVRGRLRRRNDRSVASRLAALLRS